MRGYTVGEDIKPSKVVTRVFKSSNSHTGILQQREAARQANEIVDEVQQVVNHARSVLDPDELRLLNILLNKMEQNPEYPPEAYLKAVTELIERKKNQ